MILTIHDWQFQIDMAATMEYSACEARDHCNCAYCRNFYAATDAKFPNLRPFIAQFGIDLEGPDELMPFTATNIMAAYTVSGRILRCGKAPFQVDGVDIQPEEASVSMINTECPEPYFVLSVGPFDLPWVLDEPMEEDEIVSPANQPPFLKRMVDRMLRRLPSNQTLS